MNPALVSLLSSSKILDVQQGLALLDALWDEARDEARGGVLDGLQIRARTEVRGWFPRAHPLHDALFEDQIALTAARRAGLLGEATSLAAERLFDLSPLAGLPHVARLELLLCIYLEELSALHSLPSLAHLSLSAAVRLTDLSALRALPRLSSLTLDANSDALTDLSPLAGLPLTALALESAWGLTDLSPLAGLSSLTTLSLSDASALTDLTPLAGLPRLTHLSLAGCISLSDLTPLARLPALAHLDLRDTEPFDDAPLDLPGVEIAW